jgi:hypothetical protein
MHKYSYTVDELMLLTGWTVILGDEVKFWNNEAVGRRCKLLRLSSSIISGVFLVEVMDDPPPLGERILTISPFEIESIIGYKRSKLLFLIMGETSYDM